MTASVLWLIFLLLCLPQALRRNFWQQGSRIDSGVLVTRFPSDEPYVEKAKTFRINISRWTFIVDAQNCFIYRILVHVIISFRMAERKILTKHIQNTSSILTNRVFNWKASINHIITLDGEVSLFEKTDVVNLTSHAEIFQVDHLLVWAFFQVTNLRDIELELFVFSAAISKVKQWPSDPDARQTI